MFASKSESPFEQRFKRALAWIETHRESFWAAVGLVLLVTVFVFFAFRHRRAENDEAWNQLGPVQAQITQERMEEARKGLQEWEKRFANSSAATYAKFLKADLLYKTSDYAAASQVYGDLAQSAQPQDLRPLALSGQCFSDEMVGHQPVALKLAQNFTDRYPDHFLAASMYMAQARLNELTGHPAAASAVYDRFVVLYPQSPWTALARARIQALSSLKNPPSK